MSSASILKVRVQWARDLVLPRFSSGLLKNLESLLNSTNALIRFGTLTLGVLTLNRAVIDNSHLLIMEISHFYSWSEVKHNARSSLRIKFRAK
jgi:hypothetical protein